MGSEGELYFLTLVRLYPPFTASQTTMRRFFCLGFNGTQQIARQKRKKEGRLGLPLKDRNKKGGGATMIESLFGGSAEFGSQKQASFGGSLRDTQTHVRLAGWKGID